MCCDTYCWTYRCGTYGGTYGPCICRPYNRYRSCGLYGSYSSYTRYRKCVICGLYGSCRTCERCDKCGPCGSCYIHKESCSDPCINCFPESCEPCNNEIKRVKSATRQPYPLPKIAKTNWCNPSPVGAPWKPPVSCIFNLPCKADCYNWHQKNLKASACV